MWNRDPSTLRQAEEVGEFAGQLPWGAFRRGSDVDDGDAVLLGVLAADEQLEGFAQELYGGGFTGCPGAGHNQSAAGADIALVEHRQQPALVGDGADR